MKSGYKIYWTVNATNELKETFDYLEKHWSAKELKALSLDIEAVLKLISINPDLFPISNNNVRRAVVTKLNTIYYRIQDDKVEILSFFSNRKNPDGKKL